MHRIRTVLKKAFTPITIMLIPHTNRKSLSIRVPSVGILASIILWFIGTVYVFSIAIDALEYERMKQKLNYYSSQFIEMKSTMMALKKAEAEFQRLFSFKSKEKVLESLDTSDTGSIDMESLKQEIKLSMETIGEIKDYLSQQHDLYVSTPKGWPVDQGHITSPFGGRDHPRSGEYQFHSGVDIAAEPGRPVKATADGIVSFSGWSGGSGNLVALEHGFGYSTYYAHNKMLAVRVGQKVKRGDIIGYIGSTGNSTGPHVHYEVWRESKPMNPSNYLEGRS
ncbi:MAG: M23 family metallopeptidase [Nitrospirae bacterium]|nr:M23 family metallopeptidase [Nitrospirota bacterium]